MEAIKNFFIGLGFDFKQNLKSKKNLFDHYPYLSNKINDSFYFYENPNQTNTSFYLITVLLSSQELDIIRKFIWNENKADLIFYAIKSNGENVLFNDEVKLDLYYAKATPKGSIEECKIDSFKTSQSNLEKIKNISRWQFDSGSFWLNYHLFLKKVNQKGIDKELVATLNSLKDELNVALKKIEKNDSLREEVVQALIDRTLYIKYLEDNHIINTYFYSHYFKGQSIDYKHFLSQNKTKELNRLFKIIHNIFNNSLFDKPKIEDKYLSINVCNLLYQSITGTNFISKQLRLFDFQFNVIPVEFISYIYEIFLSEKQKENGIYYTPKKLAQLILDDVILDNKVGKILDPSCGSGMFLIVAFQKLLENNKTRTFKKVEDEIDFRIKLLSENIFGIEKEITAQRFTIFSLSLQLFRGLDQSKITDYIANQLKQNNEFTLFKNYSFFENIICDNSLSQEKAPFTGFEFDFIVGNPPFFEIKQHDAEISFLNKYEIEINEKKTKASFVVGKHQISQCFFLKIKDWSNKKTRFGFVSNSSNFYNDNSKQFQDFFYSNYCIEKIYELSKVKNILFEKAKESVVAMIFNNQIPKQSSIDYYPVDMGLFSEKPFELLIIQEDKVVKFNQVDLINGKITLRDFLTGNEFDRGLLKHLKECDRLENYLKLIEGTQDIVNNGLQIVGKEQLVDEFNLSEKEWLKLAKEERIELSEKFKRKYTRNSRSATYPTALVYPKDLNNFFIAGMDTFLGNISNFQRTRNEKIYLEPKIILNRTGKDLKAVYVKGMVYYNFDIYSIFLKDAKLYYFITAIINSSLVNYLVSLLYRKRAGGSFPKIGYDAIKNIPIPNELESDLVKQISNISKDLTVGKHSYTDKVAQQLNELIFDLFDLSYLQKQRIKDYFKVKEKTTNTKNELGHYKLALLDTVGMYFKNSIDIEFSKTNFNLIVSKISLKTKSSKTPTVRKTQLYLLNEIFEKNPNENFLASQEKIYGDDCVYIIKKDENTNWSETKAYEDGQEILKHIR